MAPKKKRSSPNRIRADRVLEELARVAYANCGDYSTWGPDGVELKNSQELTEEQTAAVAEVSQTTTRYGGTVRIKYHDKIRALELLSKHLGMFADKIQVEHSGEMTLQAQVRAALLERETAE